MSKLTEQEVLERIDRIDKRFAGSDTTLHEVVRRRQLHFHNDPEVDYKFGDANRQHNSMQTTRLRNVGMQLVARLTENEWTPNVTPVKDTASGKAVAERAESSLVQIFSDYQRRSGLDIQRELAMCMVRDCYGVLHWDLDTDVWDGAPDYDDEMDELPEEEDEAKRYTDEEYPETAGKSKQSKYREHEDSYLDRLARWRAKRGAPIFVEVLPVRQFKFRLGKYSRRGQFLDCVVEREIGLIDDYLEVAGLDKDEMETDAPVDLVNNTKDKWQPSADMWGQTATLRQYWTKDTCYEICQTPSGTGPPMKVYPHYWGAPPFSLALANYVHSNDPTLAYEPALAGMYRWKPHVDRWMSLHAALAESNAQRRWFLQPDNGQIRQQLAEDGSSTVDMPTDSASAGVVPGGFKLEGFGGDALARDFVESLQQIVGEMDAAAPGTGRATFGASTQPWAARLELQQENIEPKVYLQNIAVCIQDMVQSFVDLFSGEHSPGDIYAWGSGQDVKVDPSRVEKMSPEDWRGLRIEIAINPVSAMEQMTNEAHWRELVNDPILRVSPEDYVEHGLGWPNPQQTIAKWAAYAYWKDTILPGLLRQAAAETLGGEYALGVDGNVVDGTGAIVPPQQFVQSQMQQGRGMRPQQGGMGQGMGSQQTMGNLPALSVNGANGPSQIPGLVG